MRINPFIIQYFSLHYIFYDSIIIILNNNTTLREREKSFIKYDLNMIFLNMIYGPFNLQRQNTTFT